MPFKPANMTQGSGLSNALAVSAAGGAGWSNAAKGAVKTNTARDSSSYIQRRKFAAVAKPFIQEEGDLSFKSSGCCEVQRAVRTARNSGYIVPPKVTARGMVDDFMMKLDTEPAVEEPSYCKDPQEVNQAAADILQWIERGISVYRDKYLKANNTNNRRKFAEIVVRKFNQVTLGVIALRQCSQLEKLSLPPRYRSLANKANKEDVVRRALKNDPPAIPVDILPEFDLLPGENLVDWEEVFSELV